MTRELRKSLCLRSIAAAVIIVAATLGTPAFAHSYDGANSYDGAKSTLELKIRGKISPKCEISLSKKAVEVVLNDHAGTESLPFRIDCNQRMSVVMRSLNGGLQHVDIGREARFPGFANYVPYRATFALDSNGAVPVSARSEEMSTGAGGSLSVVPYQTTGSLNLAWDEGLPLLGGQYRDVIEIRVSGD